MTVQMTVGCVSTGVSVNTHARASDMHIYMGAPRELQFGGKHTKNTKKNKKKRHTYTNNYTLTTKLLHMGHTLDN